MDASEIEKIIKDSCVVCLVARTKRITLPLSTVELFLDFDSADDNDEKLKTYYSMKIFSFLDCFSQNVNLPCSRSDSFSARSVEISGKADGYLTSNHDSSSKMHKVECSK